MKNNRTKKIKLKKKYRKKNNFNLNRKKKFSINKQFNNSKKFLKNYYSSSLREKYENYQVEKLIIREQKLNLKYKSIKFEPFKDFLNDFQK